MVYVECQVIFWDLTSPIVHNLSLWVQQYLLKSILLGVPQGSVLGPILFNVYINDLVNVSNKFKYVLFADDTNILYSDKDFKNVQGTVNKELDKIHGWLCTNTLSVNLTKNNFSKSNKFVTPRVYINNHLVELTDNVRLLGVLIDNGMTWKKHIN